MRYLYLLISMTLGSIIINSCYKEVTIPEPDSDLFELSIELSQQKFIYESRDTSYSINEPDPLLFLNDQLLALKEIRIRGKSALNFRRKSYAVFLNDPITINNRYGTAIKRLTRFKLLALAMDYTYIENRIAFGILEEAGIMPLFFKFVELKINNETQGIYLLIEDPEQYFKDNGSEYILRREYNHRIDDSSYEPSFYFKPEEDYISRYKEIYSSLTRFQGEDLYNEIAERLDIESYFRKMGIDYLLQNGDYTDEIYLYGMVVRDTIRYQLIPWDYDDIFSDKPHEVGVVWGPGTLFGKRYYESIQDVYNERGDKLIYSIEDDLDYIIAKDTFLYNRYIETISILFSGIDENLIKRVFEETSHELATFYDSYNVIEQSKYDRDETNRNIWEMNMRDKKRLLNDRVNSIKLQLNQK